LAAEKILKNATTQVKNGINTARKALKGVPGISAAAFDLGANTLYRLSQGDNLGTAAVKAVPEAIVWGIMPTIMTAAALSQLPPAIVTGYMAKDEQLKGAYNQNHKAGTMFSYQDSKAALTMRQAAVQAIQGSKMNARNALGGEASLMHRSWADRM